MASLITTLSVIRNILILVLKRAPAVEVVKEIVEVLNVLPCAFIVSKLRNGLLLRESTLRFKDRRPELEKVTLLCLLLAWWFLVCALVYRVKLAALGGVKKDFSSLLNALEEGIVLIAARCSLLVRVVTKDLLAMGALDLVLGSLEAVFRKTKNSVVILSLSKYSVSERNIECSKPTYLPVLGLSLKHDRVLWFTDLAIVQVLDLLHIFRSLDALILGEGALMSLSAGMCQEVWANRFDFAEDGSGERAYGFKVFLTRPALWQDR